MCRQINDADAIVNGIAYLIQGRLGGVGTGAINLCQMRPVNDQAQISLGTKVDAIT